MQLFKKIFITIVLLGAIASIAPLLYSQATELLLPCDTPIRYTLGTYDARFGVSEPEFKKATEQAAELWNTAAGKTIVIKGEADVSIPISMAYGSEQKVTELGSAIDATKGTYEAKRIQVEELKAEHEQAGVRYEKKVEAYNASVAAYEKDVQYWNAQGGAPPGEYAKLQERQAALKEDQRRVNAEAKRVNDLIPEITKRVEELNAIVAVIQAKVDSYNASAGKDFEQGDYVRDEAGERITIHQFENAADLRRVIAHEMGHALGLDHVENPESLMYPYSLSGKFALTEEDMAELKRVCRFK